MDASNISGGTQRQTPRCSPLLVLHINDSADDQVLFQAAASRANVPVEWHVAESVQSGISYLEALIRLSLQQEVRWIDLVLLDLHFPTDSGLDIIKYVRRTPEIRTLPIAVLTGQMNPATLHEANKLGLNAIHEKPTSFQDSVELVADLYKSWSTAKRPHFPLPLEK